MNTGESIFFLGDRSDFFKGPCFQTGNILKPFWNNNIFYLLNSIITGLYLRGTSLELEMYFYSCWSFVTTVRNVWLGENSQKRHRPSHNGRNYPSLNINNFRTLINNLKLNELFFESYQTILYFIHWCL